MDNVTLQFGSHKTREYGVCLMEAVAWFAGEPHSDRPACACPVIASFARRLNDRMTDKQRQWLKPLIPALAISRGDHDREMRRAYIAADYAVRVFAPIALEAGGHTQAAASLRVLPAIIDRQSALADAAAAAAAAAAAFTAAAAAAAAAASAASAYTAAASAAADAAASASAASAAAAAYAADAAKLSDRVACLAVECLERMLAT